MVNGKTCLECHQNLSLSDFYKKANSSYSRCKSCVLKQRKQSYLPKIKPKNSQAINILIDFYEPGFKNDNNLLDTLESFLLEELGDEQRINC